MNINIDNYEAYLLDYLEGELSPEEAAELQAFVTAQGLDWDELTEGLPHLEAPQIAFENKERLKKQRVVVPLYVKIASAAAAAGLLLTVGLWPEKQLPQMEPIANLTPISIQNTSYETEVTKLPKLNFHFVAPRQVVEAKTVTVEQKEHQMLAELKPIRANETQIASVTSLADEPDFAVLDHQMNDGLASTLFAASDFDTFDEDEDDESLSLISRGLLKLTEGRYDNFASLIGAGVRKAQQDFTETATDMALTAYYEADEHFKETKDYWEEKFEK